MPRRELEASALVRVGVDAKNQDADLPEAIEIRDGRERQPESTTTPSDALINPIALPTRSAGTAAHRTLMATRAQLLSELRTLKRSWTASRGRDKSLLLTNF